MIITTQSEPAHDAGDSPRTFRPSGTPRVAWIDLARGWCIVLVVMMHSALGVGLAVGSEGWLHVVVAFAKPFRMPDFFLVAGLFATSAIAGPLRRFLDRKVIHFAYFYALWLLVALLIKAHELGIAGPTGFVEAYLYYIAEPFSSTWFIQVLPLLYLATRCVRHWPTFVVFGIALVLHYVAAAYPAGGDFAMESIATQSTTLNGFMLFWIYFVIGVRWRDAVFSLARWAAARVPMAGALLLVWGMFEALSTTRHWPEIYGLDLLFGLLGAAAVIVTSALLADLRATRWLGILGRRSLIIYLAFFIPMAATRWLVLKFAPWLDVGLASLVVTFVAIVAPLVTEQVLRPTRLAFLFERPRWARLSDRPAPAAFPPSISYQARA